jgi:cell division protein FtsQ
MDGERRIAEPLTRRRHGPGRALAVAQSRALRGLARAGAVLFLGMTLMHGLSTGGHFDFDGSPVKALPGKLAGLAGLAADDIRITGLVHQQPDQVLSAIGVKPGGSLIGFDANRARRLLEGLDWVASAKVQRLYPNQLEIAVTERAPFAIWQRAGVYYVIDQSGFAMSGLDPQQLPGLLLITGEGANMKVSALVNHLEATPALKLKVKAAARVGDRRWTLYLDNGVKIALPETEEAQALKRVAALDQSQRILSKAISLIDLRTAGEMTVAVAEAPGSGVAQGEKLSQAE